MTVMTDYINPALWVVGNLTLLYALAALVFWVLVYGARFRWWETEAGQLVFSFTSSLLGVVVLSTIGLFVNPQRPWWIMPDEVLVWRPALRYVIYLGIAIALTRMDGSLLRRLRGRQSIVFEVVAREPRTGPTQTIPPR